MSPMSRGGMPDLTRPTAPDVCMMFRLDHSPLRPHRGPHATPCTSSCASSNSRAGECLAASLARRQTEMHDPMAVERAEAV